MNTKNKASLLSKVLVLILALAIALSLSACEIQSQGIPRRIKQRRASRQSLQQIAATLDQVIQIHPRLLVVIKTRMTRKIRRTKRARRTLQVVRAQLHLRAAQAHLPHHMHLRVQAALAHLALHRIHNLSSQHLRGQELCTSLEQGATTHEVRLLQIGRHGYLKATPEMDDTTSLMLSRKNIKKLLII